MPNSILATVFSLESRFTASRSRGLSRFRHVEQHAVRIAELELAARTSRQHLHPPCALGAVFGGGRKELGPRLHELVQIALERIEALDREAEVLDGGPLDAGARVVLDVPLGDDERHAT